MLNNFDRQNCIFPEISVLFPMIFICTQWITWMYNFQANIWQCAYNVRRNTTVQSSFYSYLFEEKEKRIDRVIFHKFTNDSLDVPKCTYRCSNWQMLWKIERIGSCGLLEKINMKWNVDRWIKLVWIGNYSDLHFTRIELLTTPAIV